jgi:hypothetical protein
MVLLVSAGPAKWGTRGLPTTPSTSLCSVVNLASHLIEARLPTLIPPVLQIMLWYMVVFFCALVPVQTLDCPYGDYPAVDSESEEGIVVCKQCPIGYFRGEGSNAVTCSGCSSVRCRSQNLRAACHTHCPFIRRATIVYHAHPSAFHASQADFKL